MGERDEERKVRVMGLGGLFSHPLGYILMTICN